MAESKTDVQRQNALVIQETLTRANFDDRASIDKIARNSIGTLSVTPEDFKAAYDTAKPDKHPEWDHADSLKILEDEIKAQSSVVQKIADSAALFAPQPTKTERAAADLKKTIEEQSAIQDVNKPLRANDEDVEVVRATTNATEESIRNRGAITESRITARPEELDAKFTIQAHGRRERYLHKDTGKEAFRDTGTKIIVKPEARKLVAADVAKLADSKGWTDIKVTGNAAFRRDVWKEANLRGIEVVGYKPTEQDKRDLDKRLTSIEAAPRDNQSEKENKNIAPKIAESTIGDAASANPEVTKKRDELGTAYRDDTRDVAVNKHPELKELYTLENAASQFAESSIDDRASQEKFVSQVRNRGLDERSRGNKLPELKVQPIRPQQEKAHPGLGR